MRFWFLHTTCFLFLLTACDPEMGRGPRPGQGPGGGPEVDEPVDGEFPSGVDEVDEHGPYPEEVNNHLNLPYPPYNYSNPDLPDHLRTQAVRQLDNTPANNPLRNNGATLGRVLFFDTQLSIDNTLSCASCHRAEAGFSDDVAFSEGVAGVTGRNSMSLVNARYYEPGHFFWDERADTLEDQVLMPIQDAIEMGLTLEELLERVESQPYYPELFARAFGDPEVSLERISFALAQYVRAIVSASSEFDVGLAAVGAVQSDFPNFSAQENLGKDLFFGGRGNCGVCHADPEQGGGPGPAGIFFMDRARNNGLDANTTADQGAGDGRFKSSSLRNVELTPPYMHDGRFDTLERVVEHYNSGVQDHPDLDNRLRRGGQPQRLNLSEEEVDAIVAFMRTLTDVELLADERFEDPFEG